MKDKTLYWILFAIGAYFVVRFIMNQISGKQKVFDEGTISKGQYNGHVEGEAAGTCKECGSPVYYRKVVNTSNPNGGYILRKICSNPDCKTNQLDY